MKQTYQELITKAVTSQQLTYEEITTLLGAGDAQEILVRAADEVRKRAVGDDVHLRGLIEFSNRCRQNCCYCGLRKKLCL